MSSNNNNSSSLTGSNKYLRYALAGGICCTATHTVLVPMDVVKTRLQTHIGQYSGMIDAFKKIPQKEGIKAVFLGIGPTYIGYSMQGACKFGFFEFFKDRITATIGHDKAVKYSTSVYLASSMMAETIATVCLCPWEALRIRMVAQPGYGNTITAFSRMLKDEGAGGFYRGIGPILMKQIPYTVTQLTVFSHCVDYAYSHAIPTFWGRKKHEMSTAEQLVVSVGCGVIAGVTSAIASHPADTILSRINMIAKTSAATGGKQQRATVSSVVNEIGFNGLWLGLGTRCFMVGLLSAMMFLIYDSVKVACGLPTTGGVAKHQDEKH